MIARAHQAGRDAALRRFKIAGPMGADYGVAPRGDEQSHGSADTAYAPRAPTDPSQPPTSMSDWLWAMSEHDRLAPGAASEYGSETIG